MTKINLLLFNGCYFTAKNFEGNGIWATFLIEHHEKKKTVYIIKIYKILEERSELGTIPKESGEKIVYILHISIYYSLKLCCS